MKNKEFKIIVEDTMAQIRTLMDKKGREYASEDAFSNFKDASGGLSFHSKPEMVAWEYSVKHLQSIKDLISSDSLIPNHILDEKINDALLYLLLIKGMMIERAVEKESDQELSKVKFNVVNP